MSEIHFYLSDADKSKSSIRIVFSLFGKRYNFTSGLSVLTRYWNSDLQKAKETTKYKDCGYINNRLTEIREACEAITRDFKEKRVSPTKEELSCIVGAKIKPKQTDTSQSILAYAKAHVKIVNRSYNTMRKYNTCINQIELYEKEKRTVILFGNVDMKLYYSLESWFQAKDWSLNYWGSFIKNFKVFYKAARSEGIHDYVLPEKFSTQSEESDSIYLNDDELKRLNDLVINEDLILDNFDAKVLNVKGDMERMITSLTDCRDRFLIGAYTAMRFSDYAYLAGIKDTDEYISRTSQKTGVRTIIPMHPVIREILRRRNNILPVPISNQKMNDQLKNLGKCAKLTAPVEITITKGGRKVRKVFQQWELLTTHCARRSGCTNMYLAGIDVVSIMSFSGHRTVKSFLKYIKATQRETAEKLKSHSYFAE